MKRMRKNFALGLICVVFCLAIIGCNKVPSDMFPKSVGAFQFKEGSKPYKDEKGHMNFFGNYVSPDSPKISCSAFDADSEEEAAISVTESGLKDDAHQPKPITDQSGKQIGSKLLVAKPGAPGSLAWNIGKRAYWCTTGDDTEKTLEEFFNNWQSQVSKY